MNNINLREYNLDTSENNIVKASQHVELQTHLSSEAKELYLNYLTNILHLKQQKQMFEDQNEFNTGLINSNKNLVKATWCLAIMTILLAFITFLK